MKKLLLLLCLSVTLLLANEELVKKLEKLGQPYGLSKSLVAIAKVESNFGAIRVNLQDPSCGVTMIHLKFFLKRYNIPDTSFHRNKACQQLINNDELAIAESIVILEYWKTKFCKKWGCTISEWEKVWAAYNAGNNYNSKSGKAYAKKIKEAIVEYNKKKDKK